MTVLRDYASALSQPVLPAGNDDVEPPRYDEVVGPDGGLRPAWKALAEVAVSITPVDLSTEFTGLITTQRAYSASSKIITTADEMLEELIRIKR